MTSIGPLFSRAVLVLLSIILILLGACSPKGEDSSQEAAPRAAPSAVVSGFVEGGLRVLTIDPGAESRHLRIYRGDYIRIRLTTEEPFTIKIPDLGVAKRFPASDAEDSYIKVPDAGTYPFTIGDAAGVIEALEFRAAAYREVDSREASELIANLKPFILDVRTAGEFAGGHIQGATLIPIQELQGRLKELKGREKDPFFIYCKSGNRSTVAGKFLVDAGFEQVINLRHGFVEWARAGLPVVK